VESPALELIASSSVTTTERGLLTDVIAPAAPPRLERVIGVGALSFSAINCIVGSGIFGLPGLVAAMLGPAAVIAYLVCAVLFGLLGLCMAEAGSGGLHSYATESFGPVVGGIAGTLLWLANSVVTGGRGREPVGRDAGTFAPGGPMMPLAASAIIIWLLSTLAWTELAATGTLVAVSGMFYLLRK
jgi:amino acid transporter